MATRGLAKDAEMRVREEICGHYESAHDDLRRHGTSELDAHMAVLASLGSARVANRQYRNIHLTARERRLIDVDEWFMNTIQTRRYLLFIPFMLACCATCAFAIQPEPITLMILFGGVGLCIEYGVPFLVPITTRLRGGLYRIARLAWPLAIVGVPFLSEDLSEIWPAFLTIVIPVLWVFASTEWHRASARRKLPIAKWPRSLYL